MTRNTRMKNFFRDRLKFGFELVFNPIQDGHISSCSRMPLPIVKICYIYPKMMKPGTVLSNRKKDPKYI